MATGDNCGQGISHRALIAVWRRMGLIYLPWQRGSGDVNSASSTIINNGNDPSLEITNLYCNKI